MQNIGTILAHMYTNVHFKGIIIFTSKTHKYSATAPAYKLLKVGLLNGFLCLGMTSQCSSLILLLFYIILCRLPDTHTQCFPFYFSDHTHDLLTYWNFHAFNLLSLTIFFLHIINKYVCRWKGLLILKENPFLCVSFSCCCVIIYTRFLWNFHPLLCVVNKCA